MQSRECDEETLIGDDDGEDEEQWQPTQKESVVVTSKPRVATPPKSTVASKPARSIPQTSPSKAPGVLSKPASPMPKNPHSKAPTVSNSPNVGPQTSSPRKTAAANGSPLRVQNQNSSKAATEPKSAAHAVLEKPAPPRSENPSSTKVEIRDGVIHRPRKREFERRKLPAQRLSADPNAGAVSAWREHKPSTLIYPLLRNFNPSSRKTDAIRTRTGTHFPMLEHIAAKTSTHLILSHKGRDFEVHIWGTDDDARSAVSWIEWWVKDMFGGTGRQRFDKVPSLSLEEWNIIEKKFVNEQRRQQFRRHPSENDRFAHKVRVALTQETWVNIASLHCQDSCQVARNGLDCARSLRGHEL